MIDPALEPEVHGRLVRVLHISHSTAMFILRRSAVREKQFLGGQLKQTRGFPRLPAAQSST
jgi:hypothetical protein